MNYRVILLAPARRHLADGYAYLYDLSPRAADEWITAMHAALGSLSTLPFRCGRAPTPEGEASDVRQLLCRGYRIFFVVTGETVKVISLYHQAQRPGGDS
jgi:hypothetical protein